MEGLTKQRLGLYLGPALFVVVMLIPPPASMTDAARAAGAAGWAPQLALGMLAWILTWWVTECMPLGLAALAVPLVFSLSGVVPWRTTLTAFAASSTIASPTDDSFRRRGSRSSVWRAYSSSFGTTWRTWIRVRNTLPRRIAASSAVLESSDPSSVTRISDGPAAGFTILGGSPRAIQPSPCNVCTVAG